jgi:hypothetical protein
MGILNTFLTWRIRSNAEIKEILQKLNIVDEIKKRQY